MSTSAATQTLTSLPTRLLAVHGLTARPTEDGPTVRLEGCAYEQVSPWRRINEAHYARSMDHGRFVEVLLLEATALPVTLGRPEDGFRVEVSAYGWTHDYAGAYTSSNPELADEPEVVADWASQASSVQAFTHGAAIDQAAALLALIDIERDFPA